MCDVNPLPVLLAVSSEMASHLERPFGVMSMGFSISQLCDLGNDT